MKTYFIDTNYFLRLLLRDNETQFQTVYNLFQKAIQEKIKISTSVVVFFELYWVLTSFYQNNKKNCTIYLDKILQMDFLEIENREFLDEALKLYLNYPLDLEDSYNLAYYINRNLDEFATFDKQILKINKKSS